MKCKVWISSQCQWKIKQRGGDSPWRRHRLFIVLSVCSSQTPKTRPVIRPAFFLHTAYSWLNTPVLQLHSHAVFCPQSFSGLGRRQVSGSTGLPHANKFAEVETWQLDRPKTQKPQPACSVKGPIVWGFGWGGVARWRVSTTGSLRSFGRVVCLCGLATVAPGFPGALQCLRPVLVHNHVVDTLIRCGHASSVAF